MMTQRRIIFLVGFVIKLRLAVVKMIFLEIRNPSILLLQKSRKGMAINSLVVSVELDKRKGKPHLALS